MGSIKKVNKQSPQKSTDKKGQDRTHLKKDAMLTAMEKAFGIVSVACKHIGIDRSTYYGWLKDDPEFKSRIDEIENVTLDFAESKLHNLIQNNNVPATIFFLKTKGRKRGYIETQEVKFDNQITGINVRIKRDRD
jgi:hypothetical protein